MLSVTGISNNFWEAQNDFPKRILTVDACSVSPFNPEKFWSKAHDENRQIFQLPSVVEQQVDIRFSFFVITQTVVMLKILYILVNDELYLQF